MNSNAYSSTKLGAGQSLRGAAARFLGDCQSRGQRRALAAECETPNKQRLGFILEALGQVELCRIVEQSLPRQLKHIMLQKQMPVTPNTPKDGDSHWRVNITLGLALL